MPDDNDMSKPIENAETPEVAPFPIVAIGSSAGGLEAFERFFTHLPANTGIAYVVIQHLDPDHESILADLIKRYTKMPVMQITHELLVEPNHVYIIPPNRNLDMDRGRLMLSVPTMPRGFRLPIDYFFRSLAQHHRESAICVVLSGAASDGSLGVKAIKGEGGMTMAQEPETARYPGMPQSAIATGSIDFILPPEEMPSALLSYLKHTNNHTAVNGEAVAAESETDWLVKIFAILRTHTGHDFSQYKRDTLMRRLERRMGVSQRDSLGQYLQHLRQNPLEVEALFKDLLIGVTRFFRDEEAFQFLDREVLQALVARKSDGDTIRVWVVGCASGEEAYGIAMLLYDAVREAKKHIMVKVFATDIDRDAVERARVGFYPDNIAADVPHDILRRHFSEETKGYQVKKHIRNSVIFAEQSLIKDPPFSRIELISCRNLLIYLNNEIQKHVIQLFHYALSPGGFLFLGTSETLAGYSHLFETIERRWKIYRRLEGVTPQRNINFGAGLGAVLDRTAPPVVRPLDLEALTQKALLQHYSHPAVIVNEQGEVLYFHEDTSPYLHPPSGTASFSVLKMVITELRLALSRGLRQVINTRKEVVHDIIRLKIDDTPLAVRPALYPVPYGAHSTEILILIVFEALNDTALAEEGVYINLVPANEQDKRMRELEQDLRATQEYLQTTIEELETANEELKSANEELQSSNEEFQSTNEELETTKEELQSVNEELITVNAELTAKISELLGMNNNQKNLLDNMDIGLIFIADDLTIRLFNPIASHLLNLIPDDVGRPIRHFAANFDYPHFTRDCERVLNTLTPFSIEILSHSDRWYMMRLRPYRTLDGDISGLVVTFADITEQKSMQRQLLAKEEIHETLLAQLPYTAVIVFDHDMRYTVAGGEALETTGFSAGDILGKTLYDILSPEEIRSLEPFYRAALRGERSEYNSERDGRFYRNIAAPILRSDGEVMAGMIVATEYFRDFIQD